MPENKSNRWFNTSQNLLDTYEQKKVITFVGIVSSLLFIPFSIKNYVIGEPFFAFLLIIFEISLLIEIHAAYQQRPPYTNFIVPIILLVLNGLWSIKVLGVYGTYWLFPIVVCITLLLPFRIALIFNTVTIVGVTILGYGHIETLIMLRFISALIVTVFISHYILRSIGRLQEKLRESSIKDPMTQVFNRSQIDVYLQQCLDTQAKTNTSSCLAMLDIDRFKQINDTLGHDVGDHVIIEASKLMAMMPGQSVVTFRLGGDEFLILFREIPLKEAVERTERLRKTIADHVFIAKKTVTVSAGVADSSSTDSINTWLKRADQHLYRAKQEGRNQVHVGDIEVVDMHNYKNNKAPISNA